jgi:DNA polymerase-2
MLSVRGFVLQPTYRIEDGRPVVHLSGRLEDGRTFLVRDRREVPHFYVEAGDAERARGLGARPLSPTGKATLSGRPVLLVEVAVPGDTPPLRDRLTRAGIACYEADVRFAMRYLIDRGLKGSISIRGEGRPGDGLGVAVLFDEPRLEPADWAPRPSVLSIDIETDPGAQRLLSIALHGASASEVLLLTPAGASCPPGALPFPDEKELLKALVRRVKELDPDVLTGWNVIDFDLAVLARRAGRLGVRLDLGRGTETLRFREAGGRGARQASVPGRVVLDGIQLLRGAFVRMDDYGLDAVAREILGEGKRLAGHGRAEEILRLFKEDRERLVDYNLTDARLALEVLQRLHLVELAVERSRLTGMPLDRVSSSIAAFDFLYLTELGRRNVVAPSVREAGDSLVPTEGGHVLEPVPGLYSNVVVLDFKSLYPSLIRTFQIDPLGLVREGAVSREADPIVAPNGAAFARRRGVLTEILDEIMPAREAAKRAGDRVKSHAIKILMNSFYGCLGTPASRFHDPRLANAITSFGREVLLWCRGRIEAEGRRVLYGDTDSLFVESGAADAVAARGLGESLAERLTRELAEHVERTWRVTSRLELQFERLYLRLFLPPVRHGTTGARKRYAGLVAQRGRPEGAVVFTGMEAVRGDWTDLAKEVQRELYSRLFSGAPVEEYLRAVVAEVRAGRLDDRLVYRKSLRKLPAAYTATTPPHVAAARKLGRRTRGRIAYVLTAAGPEPAEERQHALDYDHYVDKQVQPVAEPVLALLGLDFAKVIGAEKQLSLF